MSPDKCITPCYLVPRKRRVADLIQRLHDSCLAAVAIDVLDDPGVGFFADRAFLRGMCLEGGSGGG